MAVTAALTDVLNNPCTDHTEDASDDCANQEEDRQPCDDIRRIGEEGGGEHVHDEWPHQHHYSRPVVANGPVADREDAVEDEEPEERSRAKRGDPGDRVRLHCPRQYCDHDNQQERPRQVPPECASDPAVLYPREVHRVGPRWVCFHPEMLLQRTPRMPYRSDTRRGSPIRIWHRTGVEPPTQAEPSTTTVLPDSRGHKRYITMLKDNRNALCQRALPRPYIVVSLGGRPHRVC